MKLRVLVGILCASTLLAANDDDPYVWMEEIEGAKALEWAKAENARSLPQLQNDPRFKGIYDDAVKILTASDRIPAVSFAGDGTLRDFWQDAQHVRGIWRTTTVESYRSGTPQWRTILDLNRAVLFADREGRVQANPQRRYLTIVDGIVAGEGEGPMGATPLRAGLLVGGFDPVLVDAEVARLMGFDPARIPAFDSLLSRTI